jgi:hypothetical protein
MLSPFRLYHLPALTRLAIISKRMRRKYYNCQHNIHPASTVPVSASNLSASILLNS